MLLTETADYEVPIRANQSKFKEGDLLEISLSIPHDGYVNVVNLSPGDKNLTVLFPNGYHQENFFKAGARVTIPEKADSFSLPASPAVWEKFDCGVCDPKRKSIHIIKELEVRVFCLNSCPTKPPRSLKKTFRGSFSPKPKIRRVRRRQGDRFS